MVAASFALVRYALAQNRTTSERFTAFLERSLRRQEEVNEHFRLALDALGSAVRECVARLDRMQEKP